MKVKYKLCQFETTSLWLLTQVYSNQEILFFLFLFYRINAGNIEKLPNVALREGSGDNLIVK